MKAVSWALRQIGKRNEYLSRRAIELAKRIEKLKTKTAKRIAKEVIKELSSKYNKLNREPLRVKN